MAPIWERILTVFDEYGIDYRNPDRRTKGFLTLRAHALEIKQQLGCQRVGKQWDAQALRAQEVGYIWMRTRGLCAWSGDDNCGHQLVDPHKFHNMQIDHCHPKGKNPHGTWMLDNLTIMCGPCNRTKFQKGCPWVEIEPCVPLICPIDAPHQHVQS